MDLNIQKAMKNQSKFTYLTETYQQNFIDFIQKKDYDKQLFYEGLKEYKKYLVKYFNLLLTGKFSESPLEKENQAILFRYVMYLGSKKQVQNEMDFKIDKISEDSIIYALDIEKYKRRQFKYNCINNLINHIKFNIFNVLLNQELKEIEFYLNNPCEVIDSDSILCESILDEIFKIRAPQSVKSKLFNYLNNDIKFEKLSNIDIYFLKQIGEKLL